MELGYKWFWKKSRGKILLLSLAFVFSINKLSDELASNLLEKATLMHHYWQAVLKMLLTSGERGRGGGG